jgi:hypothetical protein
VQLFHAVIPKPLRITHQDVSNNPSTFNSFTNSSTSKGFTLKASQSVLSDTLEFWTECRFRSLAKDFQTRGDRSVNSSISLL